MIAADSSSFIAYLKEDFAVDIQHLKNAIENATLVLPPVVLTEVLSNSRLPQHIVEQIEALPVLPLLSGFWSRAGKLRAKLLAHKLKARLADCLIAQCCIDNHVSLITRDSNFRHFVQHGGLVLAE